MVLHVYIYTEDGKMMLNVYIMRYILLYICGDANNIAPIIFTTLLNNILHIKDMHTRIMIHLVQIDQSL